VIADARLPATTHLCRSCHQFVVVCLSLQQMGGSGAIRNDLENNTQGITFNPDVGIKISMVLEKLKWLQQC
jgi:hypothetical protein